MKKAFVFSGQGAQYAGMGKELYTSFAIVRETFDEASAALGFDIKELCFNQTSQLNQTEYTQPAILTCSIAFLRVLRDYGIDADIVAGLSLGEYSAYVASGAFDFKQTVVLVRSRGRFMTQAVPAGEGAMAAVMGLSDIAVKECCEQASERGFVAVANYNMPGQLVIGGEKDAVDTAGAIALLKGAKRVLPLQVSGPFHTALLAPAAKKLRHALLEIDIAKPCIPVVTNVTGQIVTGTGQVIVDLLTQQVMCPVRWIDCVTTMRAQGVDTFVEVGPGRTLGGFIKKIAKGASVYNVEDNKSLEKVLAGITV